jgi:hypothetical protein
MSNAISGAVHAQQLTQASQVNQNPEPKPAAKQTSTQNAAPQDTVNISNAARAASQAQNQQSGGGDSDHDGK